MGNTQMFSISVEPEFDAVVTIADNIARDCGMSRSVVMRTVLHDYFGVPTWNVESQQSRLTIIKQKLEQLNK